MSEIAELELQTPSPHVDEEDTVFVALGKDVKKDEKVLMWALHNSGGRKICILHVHQPARMIPMMGPKVSINLLDEKIVSAYHENERQGMQKVLDKYVSTCGQAGVQIETLYIEMDSVEKGIVQLISQLSVKWLVMGAGFCKSYSRGNETIHKKIFFFGNSTRKITIPKSKKATYVRLKAPTSCRISFIWEGDLIHTRESKVGGINIETVSASLQARPNAEIIQFFLRDLSVTEEQNDRLNLPDSAPNFAEVSTNQDIPSRRSPSVGSLFSTCPSSEIIEDTASVSLPSSEVNEIWLDFLMPEENEGGGHPHSSVAVSSIEDVYHRFAQFVTKAEIFQQGTHEEVARRKKAENDVIDAIGKAKASAARYTDLLRHRIEVEESLARSKEEVEKMKCELVAVMNAHRSQIADSSKTVQELEWKLFSAVELLHIT